jgi:hypothetical protein
MRCDECDGESARYYLWHRIKSLGHNRDIDCLATSIV